MSKVKIEVDLEEIKKALLKLPEEQREALFYEVLPTWGKALQKMEKEALKDLREGKTVPLDEV